jgi:hypothetical protein
MTANKTILSTDTNKKHAGCHCAKIAAASARPCLAHDLQHCLRQRQLRTPTVANYEVIAWHWLEVVIHTEKQ